MEKLPFFVNLITGEKGRINLASCKTSTFNGTSEYEVIPSMEHLFDIKPVYERYWIKNIPQYGITPILFPPNATLRGVERSGFVFITSQVDKDNNVLYNGGWVKQIQEFMDKSHATLLKELEDLQRENSELRARITQLSSDNLSDVNKFAKAGERILKVKRDSEKKGGDAGYHPSFMGEPENQ